MDVRTQMCFKGIDLETKLRLKMMAAVMDMPVYQLLDELTEIAWAVVGPVKVESPLPRKIERKIERDLERGLRHYFDGKFR